MSSCYHREKILQIKAYTLYVLYLLGVRGSPSLTTSISGSRLTWGRWAWCLASWLRVGVTLMSGLPNTASSIAPWKPSTGSIIKTRQETTGWAHKTASDKNSKTLWLLINFINMNSFAAHSRLLSQFDSFKSRRCCIIVESVDDAAAQTSSDDLEGAHSSHCTSWRSRETETLTLCSGFAPSSLDCLVSPPQQHTRIVYPNYFIKETQQWKPHKAFFCPADRGQGHKLSHAKLTFSLHFIKGSVWESLNTWKYTTQSQMTLMLMMFLVLPVTQVKGANSWSGAG